MIVVDSNILIYLLINGDQSAGARLLREREPNWKLPRLWRYECSNALRNQHRKGLIDEITAKEVYSDALKIFISTEHDPPDMEALDLSLRIGITTYDATYLALARHLGVTLVTEDQELITKGGGLAVNIATYLQRVSG